MKTFPVLQSFYSGTCVRVESLAHGIQRMVLARPEVRNAFNAKMIEEISEALTRLAAIHLAADMRLLLIEGEGSVFCAGADLSYMKELSQAGEAESVRDARRLGQMFFRLANFPTPVVCFVKGAAIGGGLGLAACSDFVLAESNAVFATSEVLLGIVPGVISPYVIRKVGVGFAAPFMLTGRRMTAEECLLSGLVSRVVNISDDGAKTLEAVCGEFLMAGPNAARRTKELLRRVSPLPDPALFEHAAMSIAMARCSEEGQTGLQAFFDKQTPPWGQGLKELVKAKNS